MTKKSIVSKSENQFGLNLSFVEFVPTSELTKKYSSPRKAFSAGNYELAAHLAVIEKDFTTLAMARIMCGMVTSGLNELERQDELDNEAKIIRAFALWSLDRIHEAQVILAKVAKGEWHAVATNLTRLIKAPQLNILVFYNNDSEIIDFAYLDDWHAYDHVKQELELLDPLVVPSSIILAHDLMYGHTEPFYHSDLLVKKGQWAEGGPYRAIAELDTNFWEFSTLPWSNGLTILRKKYSSLYHKR